MRLKRRIKQLNQYNVNLLLSHLLVFIKCQKLKRVYCAVTKGNEKYRIDLSRDLAFILLLQI